MALSGPVLLQILAEIQAVGVDATIDGIRSAYITKRVNDTQAALASTAVLTVSNWVPIEAMINSGATGATLYKLRDAIEAKITARDSTGLGPLLLELYSAMKMHFK